MIKIFKYPVKAIGSFIIEMPAGSKILSFQNQRDELFIWAAVDVEKTPVPRFFNLYGTGNPTDLELDEIGTKSIYISTVQHGPFVWHLFEVRE